MNNLRNNMININEDTDFDIHSDDEIALDFAKVKNLAINDIKRISDIHKVALINGKKLYIKNASPEILQILTITGIHKSCDNDSANALSKRQKI